MTIPQYQNDGDRSDLKGGRDGQPIELTKPRGERGKQGGRDPNESVLEKLLHKELIGLPEYHAGLHYHGLLRRASTGASIPELGRIPGQSDPSSGDALLEATAELATINKKQGMSRVYRLILWYALHPHEHRSLAEIDRILDFPQRMMVGRTVLIEALKELAEILGYAQNDRRTTKCG